MNTKKSSATRSFLESHEVFTRTEFLATVDPEVSERTRDANLRNAVLRGQAYRVKRGLYASNVGAYRNRVPTGAVVASRVADDVVLSHHTALEVHGVAHSPLRTVYFTTASRVSDFEVRGYRFRRVAPPAVDDSVRRAFEERVRVGDALLPTTTRERTLVDCLREPRLAGGLEELFRSVGGFVSMSAARAWEYAAALDSPTTVARLGWALELFAEQWEPDATVLDEMRSSLGRGTYRLGASRTSSRFVSRWRLYVPEDAAIEEWVRG